MDFGTLFPAFTNANLMRRFGGVGGSAFIKDTKIEASSLRTESCLKVCKHQEHELFVVKISLEHKKQDDSVQMRHCFKFDGEGRTS